MRSRLDGFVLTYDDGYRLDVTTCAIVFMQGVDGPRIKLCRVMQHVPTLHGISLRDTMWRQVNRAIDTDNDTDLAAIRERVGWSERAIEREHKKQAP